MFGISLAQGIGNMAAKIINGKEVSRKLREEVKERAGKFRNRFGKRPGLAVVIVGENPASQIYVRNKIKACEELGLYSEKHELPESTSEEALMRLVEKLNNDDNIHGFLVQLPLPKHINSSRITQGVSPDKDVDGFTYASQGKMLIGEEGFIACTPKGIMRLIDSTGERLEGKEAVVIGRSNITGKPSALLLLNRNCTVTICHSRTKGLGEHTKRAEILVVAAGKPGLVTKDMVGEGAIVIDVGTTRVEGKLKGDVDFDGVSEIAGWITPVPGGVGPMTIACLMENTLDAAEARPGNKGKTGDREAQ